MYLILIDYIAMYLILIDYIAMYLILIDYIAMYLIFNSIILQGFRSLFCEKLGLFPMVNFSMDVYQRPAEN